jgi:site-specific recombinase XerD
MKTYDISTEEARQKLKARRAPYWVRFRQPSEYLGFMRTEEGGVWYARYKDRFGVRHFTQLGTLKNFSPERRYFAATRKAESWIDAQKRVSSEGSNLRQLVDEYVDFLVAERSESVALRVKRRVYLVLWTVEDSAGMPVLDKPVADLTTDDLERCLEACKRRETKPGTEVESRVMPVIFAAVNRAYRAGKAPNNPYWRGLVRLEKTPAGRPSVPTDEEIASLLRAAQPDLRAFMLSALLTGCRPEELARLRARNVSTRTGFDRDGRELRYGQLSVPNGQNGGERVVTVSERGLKHLQGLSVHKGPDDLLHLQADGRPWEAVDWGERMQQLRAQTGLSKSLGLYSLRDKFMTRALEQGIGAEVIAKLCGTTVEVVNRFAATEDPVQVGSMLNRLDLPDPILSVDLRGHQGQ